MGLLTRSKTKNAKTDFEPEIASGDTAPLPRRASRGGHGASESDVIDDEGSAPPATTVTPPAVEGTAASQPIDSVVGGAIGADEDRVFDSAVLSILEIEGPTERLLKAFDEFNQQAVNRPAGQLVHACSPSARGIVVYDLWASRASLDSWLSATPGSPKPQVTFLRGVRVVDPTTWLRSPATQENGSGPAHWSEPLVPATDVSLPAPSMPSTSLPAPMVPAAEMSGDVSTDVSTDGDLAQ